MIIRFLTFVIEIFIKKWLKSLDLWKDFGEKVPLSLMYSRIVNGKEYIITAVNLTNGIPVHNILAEY